MSTEKSSTPSSSTRLAVVQSEAPQLRLPFSSRKLDPIEGLTAVPLLRFPTFAELAELAALPSAPQQGRDVGLFEVYLHRSPEVLLQAAQEDPERFGPEVTALLEELYSRTRTFEELKPEEQAALNVATAEFFSAPRAAKKPAPVQAPKTAPSAFVEPLIEQPFTGPDQDPFSWT